jgi:uncharacterized phage protein gp47/JayE
VIYLAYFQPYVDQSGLNLTTYVDIRDNLIAMCKNIFGQDLYLGEDTQDYQWIATVVEKIYDTLLASQLAYNNRGPATAVSTGLDGIVKINGIKRKEATYSTCPARITGNPGSIITGAIAVDKGNIKWDLPSSIIIPESGVVEGLILTCELPGPIAASPGDIIQMFNPQYGWTGITNTDSAELGSYVETDAELRLRQQISTALPSLTVLDGIKGAIAGLTGVTRSEVYENDTNLVDSRGLPPHSITVVVEGGVDQEIGNAIYIKKTPGCYTNGTTEVQIIDSNNNLMWDAFNEPVIRRFYRPTYIDIDVTINVKALNSTYTTQNTADIKSTVELYLNSLKIGSDLSLSAIWGSALSSMSDLKNPAFSIVSVTAARHGQFQGTSDIDIAFNEVTRGNVNYITVNLS